MSRKNLNKESTGKQHGGARPGAGRPASKGRIQGEGSVVMRIPKTKVDEVKKFIESSAFKLPFYNSKVRAGTPTNVADEEPEMIGFLDLITEHPEDSFVVTAQGDSMINCDIKDGDKLIVDKALEPLDGSIIVASVDGDQTVKRLKNINGKTYLYPENENYQPIPITENTSLHIWGVVKRKIGEIR